MRVGHRPGAVPGLAVVAVAGELAAAAPDRVAERQRRRAEVEQGEAEEAPVPGPGQDRQGAADRAAVPDQAGPGEEVAEQVVLDAVVVLDDEIDAGADDPAGQRREPHLVGPVDRLADLLQPPRDQGAGGDEGEREHQPEGLQRQRPEVDFRIHGPPYSTLHQLAQQRLLRVEAVLGLVPDRRALAVEHLGGDLLAGVGGQAVEDDRAVLGRARAGRRRPGTGPGRGGGARPPPRRPC